LDSAEVIQGKRICAGVFFSQAKNKAFCLISAQAAQAQSVWPDLY
jgi:hypothetical protein